MKLQNFDFRIWDKENDVYHYANKSKIYLAYSNQTSVSAYGFTLKGGETEMSLFHKDSDIFTGELCDSEKMELELWTGVCDKNNKKIFHGDILECSLKDFKTPIRFEIDWNEGNFFHLRVIKPLKRVKEVQFILRTYELSFILENSKILGNIHENKELLKEE